MSRLGLGDGGAKSRYSQSYLSSICSQSGHTLQEGRQDEDCWAVDTTVDLTAAPVLVQLKCTSSPALNKEGYRVDLKSEWVRKWTIKRVPVYVVLVVVPEVHGEWIEHLSDTTMHNTHAYWQRFEEGKHTSSIVLPHRHRFSSATLHVWEDQLDDVFGGGPT